MTLTPIEKAAKAPAQLSDAEWMQVKCEEERRRNATEQRCIRDLSAKLRELRRRGTIEKISWER